MKDFHFFFFFFFSFMSKVQTMEMKQNQIFFHGTYSNLTHLLLSKNIKVFQRFSNSKFLSFMTTEVNPNNGNETKSDIFHVCYLKF